MVVDVRNQNLESDVLVLSQQDLKGTASRSLANASHFEAEDVLVASAGADRISFTAEDGDLPLRVRRQLGALLRSRKPETSLPAIGGSGLKLQRDYRLAVALVRTAWDVSLLETVVDLRRRADVVVLWVFEMWPSDVTAKLGLAPFHLADHVLVGTTNEAAVALDLLISAPVSFMPSGIDFETFGAPDPSIDRPISLMNIGRRDESFHDLFLERARADGRWYLFDTTSGGLLRDHREHRWLLAQHYRSSNVAMTSAAKFDRVASGERALRAVPSRLFEALAAGAVMVGGPPPSEANQLDQVGEVVVHELPTEPSDAVRFVEDLARADLVEERRHNIDLARRHHDWSDRWLQVFELVKQPPPDGLELRREQIAHGCS